MDASLGFLLDNLTQLIAYHAKLIRGDNNSNGSVVYSFLDKLKPRHQIQKVPTVFRNTKAHRNAYDPVIISIGPYHHGEAQHTHAQAFKQQTLDFFVSEDMDASFFHGKVLERIQDVLGCYEEVDRYDDDDERKALAWLILQDACFLIFHMECYTNSSSTWETKFISYYSYFGLAGLKFITGDLLLLENQIPFWVMEFLLGLRYGIDEGKSIWKEMLNKFVNTILFGEHNGSYEHHEGFHLLGAYYESLKLHIPVQYDELPVSKVTISERNLRNSETYRFRSITNLQTKGINLSRSKTAISFTSNAFSGQLNLPPLVFPIDFFALYSNLIAYETSTSGNTDIFVSSFVNLMKSLIVSPNDVKLLREKGILYNDMVSDDDVVKEIKELDTFGLENISTFLELRMSMEKHCCTLRKTWAAELYHTHLRTPWTAIPLIAAFLLLGLTFVQTLFTIRPTKVQVV